MNQILKEMGPLLDMSHGIRDQALALVESEDMGFALAGAPPLGDLIRTMGDVEVAYTEAFSSRKLDWSLRAVGRDDLASGKDAIAWFASLDEQFKSAVGAVPDGDLSDQVDRGGWSYPVSAHFHTYREALLIFFGKLDLYLRALGKELPDEWRGWVG